MELILINKKTQERYEYTVEDMNNGAKLYFRFSVNTKNLPDGEYDLMLMDGEYLIQKDTLYIGDYEPISLQYKRGENTYIDVTLDAKLEEKTVSVDSVQTTVYPTEGFDGMIEVIVDAEPLYDSAYNSGYTSGNTDGYSNGYEIGNEEGYTSGKTDGIAEGYADGYEIGNTEGYEQGKTDGYNEGFEEGFAVSYDEGYNKGQEDIAANARVIDISENGIYTSKFTQDSDYEMPYEETGDDFWSYATVKNNIYNTGIIPNANTRLEFWFKPNEADYTSNNSVVIMINNDYYYGSIFGLFQSTAGNQSYYANVGGNIVNFNLTNGVLYHIILSVTDGLVINGEQIGTFSSSSNFSEPLYINGLSSDLNSSADGEFGMIKIDDTIIIPTENGFLNQNTNELLEVVYDGGSYKYTEIERPIAEGELYKTINVNVIPKISIKDYGLRFGESIFKEVPEWVDFDGVTDLSNMFDSCKQLTEVLLFDTSNVTNMYYTFRYCISLKTVPLFDTSNVTTMEGLFNECNSLQTVPLFDTSNVTTMYQMFYECNSLQTVPQFDTSNVTNMGYMFRNCDNLTSLPKFNCAKVTSINRHLYGTKNNLTDVGGWENLSCNWDDNYGLYTCPNLTYQSCINVLNGLYDFVGNGSTETRTLKVHPNFLTTVGVEISIGTAKGWTITA